MNEMVRMRYLLLSGENKINKRIDECGAKGTAIRDMLDRLVAHINRVRWVLDKAVAAKGRIEMLEMFKELALFANHEGISVPSTDRDPQESADDLKVMSAIVSRFCELADHRDTKFGV